LQRKFVIVDASASLISDLRLCWRIRRQNPAVRSIRVKLASDPDDPCPDLTDPCPNPPDLTKIRMIRVLI